MTETKLRTGISIFFMVSHVFILLFVVVLHLQKHFDDKEFTTTMGILVPALSALTTLAVTFAISVKEKKVYSARSARLSGIYVFTALLFPTAFVLMLFGLVLMKSMDAFSSFEQFKISLGAVETIFAGYTGKVMASLFASSEAT
jgi:archaellum biogenesis protein FlaJ (TadC family)